LQPSLDADTEERLDALKAALEVVDLAALPDLVRLRHDGGRDDRPGIRRLAKI
jgi:hypothetical protein